MNRRNWEVDLLRCHTSAAKNIQVIHEFFINYTVDLSSNSHAYTY